jgi:hypothetical protein
MLLCQWGEFLGKALIKGASWASRTCQVFSVFLSKMNEASTFKGFSEAVDNFQSSFEGKFGFGDNQIILLPKKSPPLGMSEDDPLQTNILEVLGTDLSSVGSISIIGGILGCNSIGKFVSRVECKDLRDVN